MSQTTAQSRILIAESEEQRARQCTEWLSKLYRTETVSTDTEVLSQLDVLQPDILLLDDDVLSIRKEDLLQIINDKSYNLQIILVVDQAPDFNIVEAGFDTYVRRPLTCEQLQKKVTQSIHRAEYNEKVNELYTLTQQRAELEVSETTTNSGESPRYATLTNRIEKIQSDIDELLDLFDESTFRAVIKQTEAIAAEQESEQRYRSMTEEVLDSSRVGTLILDANGEVVWANSQLTNYLSLPDSGLTGSRYLNIVQNHHEDVFAEAQTVERLQRLYKHNNSTERFECRLHSDETERDRWLEHWSKPINTGLYSGGRIVRYYDITSQRRRSQAIKRLHTTTRKLMETNQQDDIITTFVNAAFEVMRVDIIEFYSWNGSAGHLELTECVGSKTTREMSRVVSEQTPIWSAFIQREERRLDDPTELESGGAHARDSDLMILPIESYGVVLFGAQEQLDDTGIEFARVLSKSVATVLNRANRERRLHERDKQLSEQNTQLERLERINKIIRDIGQTLLSARSQAEIETQVCSRLSQIGAYEFVWIGRPDPLSGTVTPQAHAGSGVEYIEQVEFTLQETDTGRSISKDETKLEANLANRAGESSWRRQALNQGYRSVLTVPVRYEETTYAVLELYSDRPASFPEREQTVITELGETIGHAIHALRQREALITDQRVELELQIEATNDALIQFAHTADSDIEIQTVLSNDTQNRTVFLTLNTDEPEQLCDMAEQAGLLTEVVPVQSSPEQSVIKCRVAGPNILDHLSRRAATVERIWIDNGELKVSVTIPRSTGVRTIVQRLRDIYSTVDLTARREHYETEHTTQSIQEYIDSSLTQKQHEALTVAYQAGYFDWPRVNNSEAVAEMLDIAQPTFLQHLRAAEQKLAEHVTTVRDRLPDRSPETD